MSALEFIAVMTGHLAWPIALVFAVFALRKPLLGLLRTISSVKYGGAEVLFDAQAIEVKASVEESARSQGVAKEIPLSVPSINSTNAHNIGRIVAAWQDIERALRDKILAKTGSEPVRSRDVLQLALAERVLTDDQARAVNGLNVMRNLAVHDRGALDEAKVNDFLVLAQAMLTVLRM